MSGLRLLLVLLGLVVVLVAGILGAFNGRVSHASLGFLNVQLDLLNRAPHEIRPGEELLLQVTVQNPRGAHREDLVVDAFITGPHGRVARRTQTLSVELRTSFLVTLYLPRDAPPGSYMAVVRLTAPPALEASGDGGVVVGEATQAFEVVSDSTRAGRLWAMLPSSGSILLDALLGVAVLAMAVLIGLILLGRRWTRPFR
ncbi:MAG: hypothetical protein AAB502_07655 [Chloroflexota bacterium]